MSLGSWLGLLAFALGAGAFASWIYLRREVPVEGRRLLAALRSVTLTLIALLLLNPSVPGGVAGPAAGRPWVLVDGSLSMSVGAERERAWDRAVARARELEVGALVAVFGGTPRFVAEDPFLLEGEPSALSSRLAPVLERAIEAGASGVVVLSDLRLEDPFAVRALLDQNRLAVRFEDMGEVIVNAGMASLELPRALSVGEPVSAEVAVYGSEGSAGRRATIEVREEERLVHVGDVDLPAAGRVLRIPVELPAPTAAGTVRYEATVRLPDDQLPDDDTRVAYADVDPEEGLLVAVALSPDWELRFLLPVLEQATGLTARGYVRVGPESYVLAGGTAAQGPVDAAEVRRRVQAAEIVVLQGLSGDDPAWLREAAARRPRVLSLPADPAGAAAAGVEVGDAVSGEWYVSAEVPPSSVARDLAGAAWQGLPPLTAVLPLTGTAPGEVPMRVFRGGVGSGEPALVLLEGGQRRHAVALASGFWRWSFRAGAGRDAYRRLWAGVAGWLLADGVVAGAPLRPAERVSARGQPVEWLAPGFAGREVALVVSGPDGVVLDSVLAVPESGATRTAVLPPGAYRYRAAPVAPDTASSEVEGRFDVEAHTGELLHLPARDLLERDAEVASGAERGATRPLRTHPVPYLLLLGLLCGEWIGRRRRGLR